MGKKWKTVITSTAPFWSINFKEIWQYRDLCISFTRKYYSTKYKQTVLGPLYILLAPLLTSGIFTVVFGEMVGISTNGVPQILFYMSGNLLWSFFATCVNDNIYVLTGNAHIMGKVYFPRLIIPLSNVLTGAINTLGQTVLFVILYVVFLMRGYELQPNLWLLCVPFWFLQMALLGLGMGLLVSALTVRYRDLSVMTSYGMQLLLYATPIIYPISGVEGVWRNLVLCNPVAPVAEGIRYALFGSGALEPVFLGISLLVTLLIATMGIMLFNKVEKTFIDTV